MWTSIGAKVFVKCSLGINIHSKAIHMWVFKVVVCWSFLKIKSCNNVLVFQAVLLSRGIDSRCQGISNK